MGRSTGRNKETDFEAATKETKKKEQIADILEAVTKEYIDKIKKNSAKLKTLDKRAVDDETEACRWNSVLKNELPIFSKRLLIGVDPNLEAVLKVLYHQKLDQKFSTFDDDELGFEQLNANLDRLYENDNVEYVDIDSACAIGGNFTEFDPLQLIKFNDGRVDNPFQKAIKAAIEQSKPEDEQVESHGVDTTELDGDVER